ncbi:major facilitator superfamily domain-containing protein [Radiomyces spectabilis]|uniref:major facilitator superfamily domain-containing protein n=1 Tax=Radiomyces spectabilis TaxID=64574 RepID=UPI00221ED190|nr:major facilitator superfamily domain-containing protein [Radiomyces spectabilis]KAI8376411.1 major facilitator superfamily domain-containing protein [Radiomyces spectabilis]
MTGSDERTSLLPPSIDESSKDSWEALRKCARPLLAANFMAIVSGLNDGNLGIILPELKRYYDIPDQTVSLFFLFNAVGFFSAAGMNGYLVHRLGQLGTVYLGSCLLLVVYILLMNGFIFPVMSVLMLFQGAGVALLDGGMNVYVANVPMATVMLNVLHALYGVGAMLSPLVGTTLLSYGLSWRYIYVFLAGVACFNLILVAVCFRSKDLESAESEDPKIDNSTVRRDALMNRMTILGAAYILVYAGVEVTMGGWSYTYLYEGRHGDRIAMGRVTAGYWAGLAVGRLVLGYLAGKFGEKRMITLYTTITAVLLVVIWIVPNVWISSICIVLTGFAIGPMFPTTVSLASKVLPRNMHATSIGFMSAFGAGGAALFPFFTGQLAGHYGILIMPLTCLVMAIAMQLIWGFMPSEHQKSITLRSAQ